LAMLPGVAAHGWVTKPVSKNEMAAHHYQTGMPSDFRYEPQSCNKGNGGGSMQTGHGYSCGADDEGYTKGLSTWQQWYDAAGVSVSSFSPGEDIQFDVTLTIDHGGQAWVMVACADHIAEDMEWRLLERAQSDRGHHFMPSTPAVFAWAPLELKTQFSARHTLPKDFSCPSGQGVARWLWKTGNSCNDVNNIARKTEPFSHDEYAKVVHDFAPDKWVNGACTNPPETFIACMDFVLAGSGNSTQIHV
jgi:hypothetical protein